jgi:N-acetylglucosamine repressor
MALSRKKAGPAERALVRAPKIKRAAVSNLEAEMLRRVRTHENLSRVKLARQLRLAPSTAGAYVDRLIQRGFLTERRQTSREHGRPPSLLSLNPRGGSFVGVDFEARNIMATLVDFSQRPVRQVHKVIRTTDAADDVLRKIEDAIEELVEHNRNVLGIGIGVPGLIEPDTETALYYAHIADWQNIPLGKRLSNRFNVNIFIENNIRSMAMAELWFGEARGLKNFVCLGVRTGIGAGIVVRGQILHGRNNLAGEIGDWLCPVGSLEQVEGKDIAWRCDKLQPLEEIASVPAILQIMAAAMHRNGHSSSLTIEEVAEAANKGHAGVKEALGRVAQTLGWVLCQIDSLFNPQKIIVAGPLVGLGKHLLEPLESAIRRFGSEHHPETPAIAFSTLGKYNGALGAAALALNEWKPKG